MYNPKTFTGHAHDEALGEITIEMKEHMFMGDPHYIVTVTADSYGMIGNYMAPFSFLQAMKRCLDAIESYREVGEP